jgi:ribosomal protein S18 acetylase RimI-like enzyme
MCADIGELNKGSNMNISITTNTDAIEFNAYLDSQRVGYLWSRKNKIIMISIFEQYRNKGYCQQLLKYAMQHLFSVGHTALELSVAKHNVNALHIYKKLGFVVVNQQQKSGLLEMRVTK